MNRVLGSREAFLASEIIIIGRPVSAGNTAEGKRRPRPQSGFCVIMSLSLTLCVLSLSLRVYIFLYLLQAAALSICLISCTHSLVSYTDEYLLLLVTVCYSY
jgi:hypothetical protein